jgi:hypothetical protein
MRGFSGIDLIDGKRLLDLLAERINWRDLFDEV